MPAEAIKPKMPKGPKLKRLAFIAHPKLGKRIQCYMAKGQRLCQLKPKFQTKAGAKAPAKAQASDSAQAPKGAQAPKSCPGPYEGPIEKAPVSVKTDGLL
jgi:large subunit ribosomal protein L29e